MLETILEPYHGQLLILPFSWLVFEAADGVRGDLLTVLGRHDEAVPALATCLSDRVWWVRRHAAYALAALRERGAAALRVAVQGSADPYARDIADEALRSIPRSI